MGEHREVGGKGSNEDEENQANRKDTKQIDGGGVRDFDGVYEDFSFKSQDHVLQSRSDVLLEAINDETLASSFSSWSPSQGDFQQLESYFSGFEEEMKKQIVEEEEVKKREKEEKLRNEEK